MIFNIFLDLYNYVYDVSTDTVDTTPRILHANTSGGQYHPEYFYIKDKLHYVFRNIPGTLNGLYFGSIDLATGNRNGTEYRLSDTICYIDSTAAV